MLLCRMRSTHYGPEALVVGVRPRDASLPGSISTSSAARINRENQGTEQEQRRRLRLQRRRSGEMGDQKESLFKITHTLAMKNEEISNFICTLKQNLDNLEANSNRVQDDMQSEFTALHSALDEMKETMLTRIKQERASRTYELQSQLSACSKALESSEELLELANQTLCSSETDGFTQCDDGSGLSPLPEG
ncbi:unnamed protein product [Pleuronectes platessa]|uniref:Uncharacterized protein n=1 Tax=Pleuronectes platessa TaxID=8262 RepID=A0A9N7TJK8_PLEPL|nr:unnamed protein product [Pleuronectes platessa]